jgi:hypothetical protein
MTVSLIRRISDLRYAPPSMQPSYAEIACWICAHCRAGDVTHTAYDTSEQAVGGANFMRQRNAWLGHSKQVVRCNVFGLLVDQGVSSL